jgi:hypothetical protein
MWQRLFVVVTTGSGASWPCQRCRRCSSQQCMVLLSTFPAPVVSVHGRLSVPDKPVKAHVVIMVDYFTKAAEFAIIYDKSAAAVAKAFYHSWICRYFVHAYVTSDNGQEFESVFVHLLSHMGVQHIHTSAAHPASNGAVECVVKSFKTMLYAHVNAHPQHWVQSLPVIRMQYWSRVHAALDMSLHVAPLSIRRVVEAYSKGCLLTNDQPEAQRKLL